MNNNSKWPQSGKYNSNKSPHTLNPLLITLPSNQCPFPSPLGKSNPFVGFWRVHTDSGRVVQMMMCVLYFIRAISDNDVSVPGGSAERPIGSNPEPITVAGQAAAAARGSIGKGRATRNSIYSCRNFKRQFLAQNTMRRTKENMHRFLWCLSPPHWHNSVPDPLAIVGE